MDTTNYITKLLIAASMMMASGLTLAADGWYDGERWRALHEDPRQVARLEMDPASDGQVVGARVRSVRLQSAATASLESQPSADRVIQVPVFRDHPGGPVRVAIGGVLVQFSEKLSAEQRADWLAREGLTVLDAPAGLPWMLVASQPGRSSLELANRLHGKPEVIQASPNWWRETARR
ncbi:MAG: hypothetical protein EA370_15840 [Wenzhouxiangella sp.]|nr:MAG: hypothetical protein EA370_15840 [Wenzhouxiangella sp.]